MTRAILVTLLWAFFTQSIFARGYLGDGKDRELAQVQKMEGVEIRINEVVTDGIVNLHEGPRIPLTRIVEITLEFLPKNDFLAQGHIKEAIERNRPKAGEWPPGSFGPDAVQLLSVVLCTRDKEGRILSVTPLVILRDQLDERRPNFFALQFAISKDLVANSFLRFKEAYLGARQSTDLYLGQKPQPGALRSSIYSETEQRDRTGSEAHVPEGLIPVIPGLETLRDPK